MSKHRLTQLVAAFSLSISHAADAASLTPPNLVTASSLNNQDLLLVWPYASGGPLEAMSWSTFTALMQAALGASFLGRSNNLSDLANQTTARTNLGLGTAATTNTGTSGSTVCLLNSSCTVSGAQTYTAEIFAAPSSGTRSGLNVSPGTAPSSPNNGDVWTTSGGLFAQVNGATQQVTAVSGSISATLAYATPGTSSFLYTTQQGAFVCIAGVVSGWARLVFTPTNGTASGNLQWTNPPYASNVNSNNVNAGLGSPIAFTGGWSSVSSVYTLGARQGAGTLSFVSNAGTSSTFLTTTNATTGTSKEMVWTFNYLTSTGAC